MRLYLYSTRVHTQLFLQHVADYTRVFFIATRVQIYTRIFLIATRMSYMGFQYQYLRKHPFDIKKNKTWLMEICWALIINYLNCLNLLNLWNCSISQSINIGLGKGINQGYLESKVMLVVSIQKSLEQWNLESFCCRGVLVSGVGWRRNIPESFGGEAEREKTKLGSTIVNQVSTFYLPISFLYFKADCL